MRMATKGQAAVYLHISPAEVVRRVESGELKGRKKTASKYSDWLIEIPDAGQEDAAVKEVKEALINPEVKEEKQEEGEPRDELEEKECDEMHKKPEPTKVELPETPIKEDQLPNLETKEVKTDGKTKTRGTSRDKEVNWWFGN